MIVPNFRRLKRIYINGQGVAGRPGQRIELPAQPRAVIAFVCGADEQLERPVRFVSGATELKLGSWTETSLANYSGLATYETEFTFEAKSGERAELDFGMVGVTAEVWLNGVKVGERVWGPYTFDITGQVRHGGNALKIIVANSDANWQAQGDPIYPFGSWGMRIRTERERLQSVQQNGLLGPVMMKVQR